MLHAVNAIASDQAHPTMNLLSDVKRLMSYASSHRNHTLVFHASNMILHVQSDASFRSRRCSRSVAGGLHYLSTSNPVTINGAINTVSTLIPGIPASAAEAEYAAFFLNGQIAADERTILAGLGYPQPPTIILGDNEVGAAIAHNSLTAKKSRAFDTRYHWIQDRIAQGHFVIYWRRGCYNLADFFTKPQPVHTHIELLPFFVQSSP
jgi:hypothetical protein